MRTLLILLATASSLHAAPLQIRVATFNASLNRTSQGQLVADLGTPANAQAKKTAEVIQRVRPDIVLVNEFDYDAAGDALRLFHDNYLAVAQNGQAPLSYSHRYTAPANTGVSSGFDLDNNGFANTAIPAASATTTVKERYGNDCFGFGWFPGQYGMAVYSRFPICAADVRTLQKFLWKDMPGAVLPDQSGTPTAQDWYSAAELAVFRLSSKSHWDLPIEVAPGHVLHLLASHPTPPAFDAAEDRNGRRNHDEIRLWADYLSNAGYLYDDAGARGGLGHERRFIILGDLNADPVDGDSFQGAIHQLLNHPLINTAVVPASAGGRSASASQGGANAGQQGDPKFDTADFNDNSVGNLRVDHVLPSKLGLHPVSGGIFWPLSTEPTYPLVFPTAEASDHRLVYLDLVVTPISSEAVRDLRCERQGSDVALSWKTQAGISYRVQVSAEISAGWSDAPQIAVMLNAGNQTATAIDASGLAGQKFYRVMSTLEAP